jgi:hypothetical protein
MKNESSLVEEIQNSIHVMMLWHVVIHNFEIVKLFPFLVISTHRWVKFFIYIAKRKQEIDIFLK